MIEKYPLSWFVYSLGNLYAFAQTQSAAFVLPPRAKRTQRGKRACRVRCISKSLGSNGPTVWVSACREAKRTPQTDPCRRPARTRTKTRSHVAERTVGPRSPSGSRLRLAQGR